MRIALLAIPILAAIAGCIDGGGGGLSFSCDATLEPSQGLDAPSSGGPGPRSLTIAVVAPDGRPAADAVVAAWWPASAKDHIAVLRLRTDQAGHATALVPADVPVSAIASLAGEPWSYQADLPAGAGSSAVTLVGPEWDGALHGNWTMPAAIGVETRVWDPHDLPWADGAHLQRLQSLQLDLAWTNAPDHNADFGIALGRDHLDHYWNPQPQPTMGASHETLALKLADLQQYGWTNGTSLRAGPSVSTGGYAATPIPYDLAWKASFATDTDLGDLCRSLGPETRIDAAGSGAATQGSD